MSSLDDVSGKNAERRKIWLMIEPSYGRGMAPTRDERAPEVTDCASYSPQPAADIEGRLAQADARLAYIDVGLAYVRTCRLFIDLRAAYAQARLAYSDLDPFGQMDASLGEVGVCLAQINTRLREMAADRAYQGAYVDLANLEVDLAKIGANLARVTLLARRTEAPAGGCRTSCAVRCRAESAERGSELAGKGAQCSSQGSIDGSQQWDRKG